MHLSNRLNLCLLGGVAAVSMIFAMYQAVWEMHTLRDEVARQALVLAESQRSFVEQLLENGSIRDLQAFVDQFKNHERLAGIAVYDATGKAMAITSSMPRYLGPAPTAVTRSLQTGRARGEFFRQSGTPMHVLAYPVAGARLLGAIAVFHNVGYTGAPLWRQGLTSVAQTFLIVGITLLLIRWSFGTPMKRMTQWLRDLHSGKPTADGDIPKEEIFQPLASEVTRLATSLNEARAAAEAEARLRDTAQDLWTPERLRIFVRTKLNGSRLFAVSNREPYEHSSQAGSVVWKIPPSGLVTALEPVLRACDGTWIAQGTGTADRETADKQGRLRVPPDRPQYTLRRVWVNKEEEDGFYFGFANEGLWPLCHIAHTRPIFRPGDWEHYRTVNRKFAAALLDEMAGEKDPLVLVQDYHFALLPQMVKEQRPDARVAIFWHIPWPNPEAFSICPWQRELLTGMLGADLIGFHIQAHCNNFLDSVDRALESRIDREHFAVCRQDHRTAVKPFPISVEFGHEDRDGKPALRCGRPALCREFGLEPGLLGVGVDRVDYTKGILERFRGIECLLDQYPSYRGGLTFIQIGAPSRTHIRRYQDLMTEVGQEAERINRKFGRRAWKPILFLNRQHTHDELRRLYQAVDFCLVTSLHDGMNLVAKEYVASRDDEQGVLILSRFTGASHELADALIVNPYDTSEIAASIHAAVTMSADEKKARMRRMRATLRERNVYRWAGSLIGELAGIRIETAESETPIEVPEKRQSAAAAVRLVS